MLSYSIIHIYTCEEARFEEKPLWEAIIQFVADLKIAARCFVVRGVAGSYESGEVSLPTIEVLSFNCPLRIDILLPTTEAAFVLPEVEQLVEEGVITLEKIDVIKHKTKLRLFPRHLRVRDVMTCQPTTVSPSTPLIDAVATILQARFNGLPVVDSANRPVGVVTQGDLLSRANLPLRPGLLAGFDAGKVSELCGSLAGRCIEAVMTRPAVVIGEQQPLMDAVDLMLARSLKRLPVVAENGQISGILSRSDIFRVMSREAPNWRELREQRVLVAGAHQVQEIMERNLTSVSPDTPVAELLKLFAQDRVQRIPVVDPDGRLLGLITDKDILSAFSDHKPGLWDLLVARLPFCDVGRKHRNLLDHANKKTAADYMRTNLLTTREDASIDEAMTAMTRNRLKRLPVVDANGVFRGLISRDSLLRLAVTPAG